MYRHWQDPHSWRKPPRVAYANVPGVNPQDPGHALLLESDVEVVAAPLLGADGKVNPEIADADVIVCGFARLDQEFFAQLQNPRLFVRPFVGYDDIDIDAATAQGVLVCNMADAIYEDVANQTMALMLALDRQVITLDRWVKDGHWANKQGQRRPEGLELHRPTTKTLGLVGLGTIGRAVAKRAHTFGYTIIASDPYLDPQIASDLGIPLVSLDELLRTADVVSVHCYLNQETRGMINAEKLALMKPTAVLVNTARGPIVDEPALIDALERGQIAGAGLDVMQVEPLAADSPLTRMSNVVLSPHIAGTSVEGHRRLRQRAGEVARQVATGGLPERHMVVNKGLLDELNSAPELAHVPRY